MARISVPVASRLPSSLRISPSNPVVTRILGRLSRPSLLSLVLDWLADGNQALTGPYLRQRQAEDDVDNVDNADNVDDDDFYPPAPSLEALREHYSNLQERKGSKREVLDRVLEGDWRHGVSMYQLAMADVQYLYDHPTSQKWTAFRIVPMKPQLDVDEDGTEAAVSAVIDREALVVPRFHPSTFLRNLQAQILPDIKVHYNFDRHKTLPLLLLRIFILDSPYNTARAVADGAAPSAAGAAGSVLATVEASRTVYISFPDASPFVYLSSSQTNEQHAGPGANAAASAPTGRETRSLRNLVVEAIPKALSRPQERYGLRPTSMVTRNLTEMLHRRGAGRTNTAGGGWAIYADEKTIESPLNSVLPTPPLSEGDDDKNKEDDKENRSHTAASGKDGNEKGKRRRALSPGTAREQRRAKRRRLVAEARFGPTAKMDDGQGVERVDVVMQDPFPGNIPEEQEDVERPAVTAEPADRGRTKGGRRSQIGAALAREIEVQDNEDIARGADEAGSGSSDAWRPQVAFTFHGSHVFAGIRQLVEAGVIDGEKMPGWMTGEEGVTVGAVRHGRIRGHKGSGMM